MATIEKQFDKYHLFYYADKVNIYCLYGGKNVGQISFVKENVPIPKNSVANDFPTIYFSLDRFNDIINILRFEKPLYLSVYESGDGAIRTSIEPVGEQEPKNTA